MRHWQPLRGRVAINGFTMILIPFALLQFVLGDFYSGVFGREAIYPGHPSDPDQRYSQKPEGEVWEQLTGRDFQLTHIDWQLVTNPESNDKYMNKHIIGTVQNNSKREFSELKIEFTIYDEKGSQIAIVFSQFDDLEPGGIWKFEIPVTSDVEKAELKGLYVSSKRKTG